MIKIIVAGLELPKQDSSNYKNVCEDLKVMYLISLSYGLYSTTIVIRVVQVNLNLSQSS